VNAAKAIELALASIVRTYCQLGGKVRVIPWQTPASDSNVDPNKAEDGADARPLTARFPCIDIRATPPVNDEGNPYTYFCDVALLCCNTAPDDADHATISGLFGEVQELCEKLREQQLGTEGAELAALKASIATTEPSMTIANVRFVGGTTPFEDADMLFIGTTMRVDYVRAGT